MKPYIKNWILSNKNEQKVIIAYAMTSTFTKLLKYAKKIDQSAVTCLIVPDLPQYMDLSNHTNNLYKILKGVEIRIIRNNMKSIDCYVVLTHQMISKLEKEKPYVVVEGISTDIFSDIIPPVDNREQNKTIVYTGGLNEKYGILELINAFQKLEGDDLKLIVCGSGDAEESIIKSSYVDNRIIFKGQLKRESVLLIQKSATILVNPRSNNEEYTKYSFPSKILEYMSSGTPVIAYMLDGIPKEYENYIYAVDDSIEDCLYMKLKEVLHIDNSERLKKGKEAREFVLNEKNGNKQCEKILNMIKSVK